ncbi:MAG: sodium:proton antiporter [Alphaproteobacteria bacterium]|nr:sodium:proton antiporter [Alphaproteobacteria bacterium]
MDFAVALTIFATVFALIYRGRVPREYVVLGGGATMAVYGMVSGFYPLQAVVGSIYFETLALCLGMSLVSAVLARSGVFGHIAATTVASSLGNGWWVFLVLTLMTYGISLVVNNLAAIVIVLPVTLAACRQMRLNPVPVAISEIVAANLGGASSMIGDFPNMIIASAGRLGFIDFLGGMMAPCLILLAFMLLFFNRHRELLVLRNIGPREPDAQFIERLLAETAGNPRLARAAMWLLGATILGFLLSDWLHLRPAWIALIAGLFALLLGDFQGDEIAEACGVNDIAFFTGLFVMVGGLIAAGAGDTLLAIIHSMSGGQPTLQLLALMWLAAFLTIFLNAGPTTALFVPVAAATGAALDGNAVWWALSLGVLAGSSAALTGATAGSIAASRVEWFLSANPDMRAAMGPSGTLDFKGYLRWGLPIMGVFLGLSTLYIIVVAG